MFTVVAPRRSSMRMSDVVGDGTLWLVLVATLGGTSWYGVGTDIGKAVALREVFAAPQLLASATSGRVTGLLGKIRIDDAKAYVARCRTDREQAPG